MNRFVRVVASALVVLMLIASAGCYGSFSLITKVYKWNGTFGSKWVNEIGFLALNIIPVYGISGFIDAVVLNTVEFWTGSNPLSANLDLPAQGATVASRGEAVELTSRDGQVVRVATTADGAVVTDAAGTVLARSVRTTDGVDVYDGNGVLLGSMTRAQIDAMASTR